MVAEAMGLEVERIEVEGELDLAGTLGVSKEVPVGFERIRTRFGDGVGLAKTDRLRIDNSLSVQFHLGADARGLGQSRVHCDQRRI